MKRWYASSVFFSLVLMVACMATIPQAAYAKVGPQIGTASASLTHCTKTACKIELHVVTHNFSPKTEYKTYISSSVCPNINPNGIIYGGVQATSDSHGHLNQKGISPPMAITNLDSQSWQVCLFIDQNNVADPITQGNFKARGHLVLTSGGKRGNAKIYSIT
jgi:hypothetical protein